MSLGWRQKLQSLQEFKNFSFLPFSCFGGEKEEVNFRLQLNSNWIGRDTLRCPKACQVRSTTSTCLVEMHTYTSEKIVKTTCLNYLTSFSLSVIFTQITSWKSKPIGVAHAARNEHQGVAFPTHLEASAWCCRCLPTQWQEALPTPRGPAGCRGTECFAFPWQTLFHRVLWASGAFISIVTRSGTSHRPQPSCKVQSDRDAPRINLTDATGLHPTWIWASVYSWQS